MENFSDQTAIVTGATRGIGKAISTALLKRGATVLGIYGGNTKMAEEMSHNLKQYGDKLKLYRCDISDEVQVQSFYAEIEQSVSSVEILVNNAGIRRDAVVALMKGEDWHRVIDVNLTGTFLMSKPVIPLMMKNKYGRIVTITSPVAHLGFAGQANYSASKAGQVAFSRSLAKETAKKKITVNCVSPGFIGTDFIEDLPAEQLSAYKKMVPMRRFGTVEEVTHAVLFLASKNAGYITGTVIDVNGGLFDLSSDTALEILNRIPHREPFLWVDEIISVGTDQIVTRKTIAEDLDIFRGHYPGNPIMPGVLLCEIIFQTGALLISYMVENNTFATQAVTPIVTRIESAKFKKIVRPGDQLEITVRLKEILSSVCFMRGTIRVNGKVVTQADFACTVTNSM